MHNVNFDLGKGAKRLHYGSDHLEAANATTLRGEITFPSGVLPEGFYNSIFVELHFGVSRTPKTYHSGNRVIVKGCLDTFPDCEMPIASLSNLRFVWKSFSGNSNDDADTQAERGGAYLHASAGGASCSGLVCYKTTMHDVEGLKFTTTSKVPYTFKPIEARKSRDYEYRKVLQGGNFDPYELPHQLSKHVKFEGWKRPTNLLDPEREEGAWKLCTFNLPETMRKYGLTATEFGGTPDLFYVVSPEFDTLDLVSAGNESISDVVEYAIWKQIIHHCMPSGQSEPDWDVVVPELVTKDSIQEFVTEVN